MEKRQIVLQIFGSRGSYSIDTPSHHLVGGLTSSLALQVGQRLVLFDAGSGLARYQSANLCSMSDEVYLFLTHLHLDHINGLVGFHPLYNPKKKVYIFGPKCDRFKSLEAALETIFSPPFHPISLWEMKSQKEFYEICDGDVVSFQGGRSEPLMSRRIDKGEVAASSVPTSPMELSVECIRNYSHPKSGVTIFCITAFGTRIVFATDVEGAIDQDPRVAAFANQCDLLIHDAMYTDERYNHPTRPTRGYGHSTIEQAAQTAARCGAKRLLLFHHDPLSTDEDLLANLQIARGIFPNTELAMCGDVVTFE